jgi:CheY-like chemotaxis protein
MSHELRSPLNAILGFSQVMLRNDNISIEQAENIQIIYRSGEYLLTLINQVLDLSKIEAGKTTLNLENVDLHHLLQDLEDMFHLQAIKSGLQLVFEYQESTPQHIYTDGVKLRQVLINLLSNALKFTHSGTVKLQANLLNITQDNQTLSSPFTLNFIIQDTGVGISTEELPQIFEAFNQAQAGRETHEGTGLGLAISRRFIELMNGDISVTSQLGEGTTFQFQIQTDLGAETLNHYSTTSGKIIGLAPDQPTYKILVVDDKLVNRQLLRKFLEPLGFAIEEASNGREAIDLWETWLPHLILMDMRMPVMDGYEATTYIKSTLQGQATAIVALTASVLEEEKTVILSTGCDDFIRKPFREQTIFDALERHLGVSYLYAETSVISTADLPSSSLTPEDLNCMPESWLNDLYNASLEADSTLVLELIKMIPASENILVQSLTKLTRQFQFEQIMELTQPLVTE